MPQKGPSLGRSTAFKTASQKLLMGVGLLLLAAVFLAHNGVFSTAVSQDSGSSSHGGIGQTPQLAGQREVRCNPAVSALAADTVYRPGLQDPTATLTLVVHAGHRRH